MLSAIRLTRGRWRVKRENGRRKPVAVYGALIELCLNARMIRQDVSLPLPSDLVATLHAMALERGEPFEDLVRGMLDREVTRLRSARTSAIAEQARVARLQRLLAPEMARATGWADLQARLALYGVALKPARKGVMLHDHITGERLCSSAALGFGARELAARFGGEMAAPVAPEGDGLAVTG